MAYDKKSKIQSSIQFLLMRGSAIIVREIKVKACERNYSLFGDEEYCFCTIVKNMNITCKRLNYF